MWVRQRTVKRSGFTLVELLTTIAIVAVLVVSLVVFIPSFINWAQQTSDKQTLTILNDALTRYKCEGGSISALTSSAPVANVLARLQSPINWAGMTHQVMQNGKTYLGRSISAAGSGPTYRFTRYHSSEAETGGRSPTGMSADTGNLIGFWTLDEGSGTAAADASPSGISGLLTNGTTWTTGRIGNAAAFDGSNDNVLIANPPPISFGAAASFSIFGWINGSDTSGTSQRRIFGRDLAASGSPYFWLNFNNGVPQLEAVDSTGSNWASTASRNIADGNWHHVGFVIDRTLGKANVFIDGALEHSSSVTSAGDFANASNKAFYIGSQGGASNAFHGSIDEVRIYNRALSTTEVQQLFQAR